ncbi:hypothetical protein PHMEG_0003378 [Phytophthora megakarya]|uniref:Uncharacterized protein n=1 Tax=Phytophthora megakarya TaxID=4795 RepID=A0A225WWI6_9STRA|nr:hypothetical protein PHMEG_0003378 [Phytophthora megakarya]
MMTVPGRYGPPTVTQNANGNDDRPICQVDKASLRALSKLVRVSCLTLESTIRLWRGQTAADPRPNKAFSPDHFVWLLHGMNYSHMCYRQSIRVGVQHPFRKDHDLPRRRFVKRNHKSATVMEIALLGSVENIQISPFECVPGAGVDRQMEARVIHDLSYPHGASINDQSGPADLSLSPMSQSEL